MYHAYLCSAVQLMVDAVDRANELHRDDRVRETVCQGIVVDDPAGRHEGLKISLE